MYQVDLCYTDRLEVSSCAGISIGRSWIGSVKHSGDGERSLSSRSAGASRSSRSRSSVERVEERLVWLKRLVWLNITPEIQWRSLDWILWSKRTIEIRRLDIERSQRV